MEVLFREGFAKLLAEAGYIRVAWHRAEVLALAAQR
jgi:hypothetical protein